MKKIFVTRSSMPEKEEYFKEIEELWDTHFLTNMGIKHQELEKNLKEYLGVPDIELFSNGHMALELAIQAFNLSGEVITTPFTFVSTTHAIVRNGLTPVFCDINMKDYTIDVDQIEDLITEKTSAIVPVHVYGHVCNVEKIEEIARKYHLKVIYDAAHAFGVTYKGIGIGNYGDASMFSFHATKVFNTIEGGAVCLHDELLKKKLYNLKNFGIQSEEVIEAVGANAKMNEFQAAMGICNLKHVNDEIKKRRLVAEHYRENLKDIDGLVLPPAQEKVIRNYAYFPILVQENICGKTRNDIYEQLKCQDIYARKYFYPLTNCLQCYGQDLNRGYTPNAKYVSERILTLPMYADLTEEEVDRICNVMKE